MPTYAPSTINTDGIAPPSLYEAALVGDWETLMQRIKTHPSEAYYCDRSINTPLHLACRRQPPLEVIRSFVQVLLKRDRQTLSQATADGLTALHVACHCGASSYVISLLL